MLPPWSGSSRPNIQQDPSSFNPGAHRTTLLPSAGIFYGYSCSSNSSLWVMCQSPNTLPHTKIHTLPHTYLPSHTHAYTHTHISTYAYIYPHIHTHIHACIYTYTYAYMHTHAHTHIHIPSSLTLRYLFPVLIMRQELSKKPAIWEVQNEDRVCYVWFPGQHIFPGQNIQLSGASVPTQAHLDPNKSGSFLSWLPFKEILPKFFFVVLPLSRKSGTESTGGLTVSLWERDQFIFHSPWSLHHLESNWNHGGYIPLYIYPNP